MRGYYGYRRKNRLPLLLVIMAVLLVLGFAGKWGWSAFMSSRNTVDTSEVSSREEVLSKKISLMVASNDIQPEEHWVRIRKADHILELYKGQTMEKQFPIAVGAVQGDKQMEGDNRTPLGAFKIQQIQNSTHWVHDFGDGKGPIEGAYGPYFIRLDTGWDGIGIHGTHDPSSIGSDITAGCVRMLNEDLMDLVPLFKEGDMVIIEE